MYLFGFHQSSAQIKLPTNTNSPPDVSPAAPPPLRVANNRVTQVHASSSAGTISSPSNQCRPLTIAELAALARENIWDPSKDLRHWLHSAERSRRTAEVYCRLKDYEAAFVEFVKAATLIVEKIPTHTEYRVLLNDEQRHNLCLNGRDILDNLSLVKSVIVKRCENWQREQQGGPSSSGTSPECGREAQVFTCGICLESHRMDFLACAMPCGHLYCRHCLKGYAVSKIEERRYPIRCPGCSADKDRSEPAELNDFVIQHLGLNENQYQIFNEMQMGPFATVIHCRKCLNTIFVDKEEYQGAQQVIICPLPGCNHVWCKLCSQTIETGKGPKHSCDGSFELDHLMRQRGWKHCPGCQTPAEKIDGCNHMTCVSPGCNTHFCYVCGELITKSVLRTNIRSAVSQHYGDSRCTLF